MRRRVRDREIERGWREVGEVIEEEVRH